MMLKKAFLFLLATGVVFSCHDVEKLLKFTINDHTAITIESASPLNLPLEIPTPAVTSNSQQQYENNNTHANLVQDVRLKQLRLSITQPEAKTFTFLKSIHVYISSSQNDEIELASLDNIESDASVLDLVPTQQKLDAYVKASSYNLRTEVTTRETLSESVDVSVDLQFQVTANPF
jgi:hypothetical protein